MAVITSKGVKQAVQATVNFLNFTQDNAFKTDKKKVMQTDNKSFVVYLELI